MWRPSEHLFEVTIKQTYLHIEEEASVGEAFDGGARAAGEEGAELVAVQDRRQAPRGAAREKHLVGGGHPDGEQVFHGFLPDPLAPEVEPGALVEGVAGEGRAVAVPDLHTVPVVEVWVVGGAGAHDAGEGDEPLHVVGRPVVVPRPELAGPRVVAPPAALHRSMDPSITSGTLTLSVAYHLELEGWIR